MIRGHPSPLMKLDTRLYDDTFGAAVARPTAALRENIGVVVLVTDRGSGSRIRYLCPLTQVFGVVFVTTSLTPVRSPHRGGH